ncbi:Crp/Fnr family transcriptional regulator [Chthonobacter albigriseus]|uniref:Crp/Fnr family transcriptional regulator n=1 Tax=Chthonobacter albigriseus TaxID=1683161 RepID=UPI0015EEBC41|nr:Crp/Fnr family transcriptional regulator [Chthonobacter albigriseus]
MSTTIPFPALLEPEAERLLQGRGQSVRLPAGERAFRSGDACSAYLWVTSGIVRVQIVTESGRERVLYRVGPGDSCVLTTSCLFGHEPYAAEGLCETDVTAVAIPVATFRDLLGISVAFREIVLSDYARRVGDLLLMLDLSMSRHIANRLAALLLQRGGVEPLGATHQELAIELGSAREVISRALKDFERRGLVSLARGRIAITDRSGLQKLADV